MYFCRNYVFLLQFKKGNFKKALKYMEELYYFLSEGRHGQ